MEETRQKTIGQIMFREGSDDNSGFYHSEAEGQNYRPYMEIRKANGMQEVAKEIYVLKLLDTTKEAIRQTTAYALENVLKNLQDPERLAEALAQQLNTHSAFRNRVDRMDPEEFGALARHWREYIGSITLDVFFEKVFEKNSHQFFQDTREPIVLSGEYTNQPQAEAEEQQVLKRGVTPHKLLSFIDYFSRASRATKKEQVTRIRKFLKMVLDGSGRVIIQDRRNQPLANYRVGISNWSKEARAKLANALVANGMYEECLDYNIEEAYRPLFYKFLGGAQEKNALVQWPGSEIPYPHVPLTWEEALEKVCSDKDWGHLWSVLTRMGMKCGFIKQTSPFAFAEELLKRFNSSGPAPAVQRREFILHFSDVPCEPKEKS